MAAQDLTTLSDAKAWIAGQGNTIGNTDDLLLIRLVTAASNFMLRMMNREAGIVTQTFTERFDGNGSDLWMPSNAPVTAITSVVVNGVNIPQSSNAINSGWFLNEDTLVLIGYKWEKGRINCVVTYTAGYANQAAIPAELQQGCIELVALKYRRRKSINLVSEGIAGAQTSFTQADVTPEIRAVIEQHTRRFPF